MKNNADKKIFISYRVQDTSGETGRLVDALKQYFTDDQLFMDIENLEPGIDFTEGIEKSLSACDVFLAVIGPHWAGERSNGSSRINEEDDWVRTEVGTALRRNIRVVPVLVDGGSLPKAEDLPPELQPLLKRQAI
ncbi:MAG TPA: toll/interleukin-1 receptor domain-containing protein, partial [Flavisolibacter sp.]